MAKEKINEEILKNVRETLFSLEPEDGWIKVSEKELIEALKDKFFDEIIISRDIVECIREDETYIIIAKKNGNFYVRDEKNKENRITDFNKLIETLK
ncbi:MAG: hypothetical protein ACTSYR_04865 [Candidatus Odinarchaeia archaeon]